MSLKNLFRKTLSFTLTLCLVLGMVGIVNISAADVDFPDVYPTNKIEKIDAAGIKVKVDALINTMTDDEFYKMLGGSAVAGSVLKYGTGYVGGVPRLGVPVLRMWDGPKGVISNSTLETTSPSSELSLASSFSEDLAFKYGQLSGSDNKATAGNVQLGVQLDNVRTPFFSRSRDSLGEDPYLTAMLATKLSAGVESENVMSTLKHMAAYSNMFVHPRISIMLGMPFSGDDVIVDEQTLNEIYLSPYEKIVKDKNASAVMTSFNRINGVFAGDSAYLQNDILRDRWGFTGVTMTDWGASQEVNVHLGTDLQTGEISFNTKANIEAAIAEGKMTFDDVKNAVRHTLTAMGQIGYLGLVEVNNNGTAAADPQPPVSIELSALTGEARTELLKANDAIALESAVKGAVLLKNENNALPVKSTDSIAMIGLTGQYTLTGHYSESSFGWLQSMTSPYENMVDTLGSSANITPAVGLDIAGSKIPDHCLFTTADADVNGVTLAIEGGDTSTINNVEVTTGTIDGKVNRTYKNSNSVAALVYASPDTTKATITTYLKAPETGAYELKMSGIGGSLVAKINISGEDKTIPFGGAGLFGFQDANTGWATGSLVCTPEGMNISSSSLAVNLVKDQVYKIVVTTAATSETKDQQLRLTWFKPGQKAQDREDAINAAKNNKKVIVFLSDLGNGNITPDPKLYIDIGAMTQRDNLDFSSDQVSLLTDIIAAAKDNDNEVIVVLNIGMVMTMPWIDDVDAVLNMWLPGQQGGKATAQLLTGAANPSGKLPVTFPVNKNDTQLGDVVAIMKTPAEVNKMNEGIFCGYRWYDKEDITPLFAFGHGLSYTNFAYSDLAVTKTDDEDYGFDVTFKVKNNGSVKGTDVAQVYLGEIAVPENVQMAKKQLAAFKRIEDLEPGELKTVSVKINKQSLSYWDSSAELQTRSDGTKDKWTVATGTREIMVGNASDNILLTKNVNIAAPSIKPDVTAVTGTYSVTLMWNKVEGQTYTVTNKDGSEITVTITETDGQMTASITGLSSNTNYSFLVNATKDGVTETTEVSVRTNSSSSGSSSSGGTKPSPTPTASPVPTEVPGETTAPTTTPAPTSVPSNEVKDLLAKKFTDAVLIPSWSENAVADLAIKGIISGRDNGTFDPNGDVTRAEFVKLIVAGLGFEGIENAKEFTDVMSSDWFKEFVDIATSNAIAQGVGEGLFAPLNNISRQDLCLMVVNAMKAKDSVLPLTNDVTRFPDDSSIAEYAKDAVYTLKALNIVRGRTTGDFDPVTQATRAEAAVIIKGALDALQSGQE